MLLLVSCHPIDIFMATRHLQMKILFYFLGLLYINLFSPVKQVKVCDICGDIGREELLAVCSECNDGAEHM